MATVPITIEPITLPEYKNYENIQAIVDEVISRVTASLNTDDVIPPSVVANFGKVLVSETDTFGYVSEKVQYSIEATTDNKIQLVGDEDTPGANQVYGTDGSGNKGWVSGVGYAVYNVPGNYSFSVPSTSFTVHMIAGGGGGGSAASSGGGGTATAGAGEAGKAAFLYFTGQTVGSSVSITVGAGGAGGAAATAAVNPGSQGGSTVFGATTVAGGFGGSGAHASAGSPVTGASRRGCEDAISGTQSGAGANSAFGGGGDAVISVGGQNNPGLSASGHGAGGSGGCTRNGGVGSSGGNGSPGLIIVRW